jgi:hypothetical protein
MTEDYSKNFEDKQQEEEETALKKKRLVPKAEPWDVLRVKKLLAQLYLEEDPVKLTEQAVNKHATELQTLTRDLFFSPNMKSAVSRMFTYSAQQQKMVSCRQQDVFVFRLLVLKTPDEHSEAGELFNKIERGDVQTLVPGLSTGIGECVVHDPRSRTSTKLCSVADVNRHLGVVSMMKLRVVTEKTYEATLLRINEIHKTLADWFCYETEK